MGTVQSSPFIFDEPVSAPGKFLGRTRQVRDVLSRLGNMDSSSILGEWHVGKTSLLKYISHPEVLRQFGFESELFVFVYLDLQSMDHAESPLVFWHLVFDGILHSTNVSEELRNTILEAQKRPDLDARDVGNLLEDIGRQGQKVVLLLDEFDSITGNPNFDVEFYNKLRALAIGPNLVLITSSRRELVDACYSLDTSTSPFFNIFANIDLGLFTDHETDLLINKTLEGTSIAFTHNEREYLSKIACCQPFFLQVACHYLFVAHSQGLKSDARLLLVNDGMWKNIPLFFARAWDNAAQAEKITLLATALLKSDQGGGIVDIKALLGLVSKADREIRGLLRRGLLCQKGDECSLFSSMFTEWIMDGVFAPAENSDNTMRKWLGSFVKNYQNWIDPDGFRALSNVRPEQRDLIKQWIEGETLDTSKQILSVINRAIKTKFDHVRLP